MPIGLGTGLGINLDTLGTAGARTPTSMRSSTSQMRFPVPPERNRELSETGHVGVAVPIARKPTNETLDTKWVALKRLEATPCTLSKLTPVLTLVADTIP